jgi:hypothetical protein
VADVPSFAKSRQSFGDIRETILTFVFPSEPRSGGHRVRPVADAMTSPVGRLAAGRHSRKTRAELLPDQAASMMRASCDGFATAEKCPVSLRVNMRASGSSARVRSRSLLACAAERSSQSYRDWLVVKPSRIPPSLPIEK